MTLSRPALPSLQKLLDNGVRRGDFPAAQAVVIREGQLIHASAHGVDHLGRETTHESLFDVASVTKAAATTLATAVLIGQRTVALKDPASRLVPDFVGGGRESVTIRELLAHGSGLPAWKPMFVLARDDEAARSIFPGHGERERDFVRSRDIVIDATLKTAITETRGSRVYSDLGFIVLGLALEQASGLPLDRFCHREVFSPLGLVKTGFIDLSSRGETLAPADDRHILPTGRTRPREPAPGQEALYAVHDQTPRFDPGEVDDDNAFAMGGVAGHAGLFSTAQELATLGWLVIEEIGGAALLGPAVGEVLESFSNADTSTTGSERGLGFDRPAPQDSLVGDRLGRAGPRGAIGHFGFTGCSWWMDLDRSLSVALLTNRTFHPSLGRANVEPVRAFRRAFHEGVIDAVQ